MTRIEISLKALSHLSRQELEEMLLSKFVAIAYLATVATPLALIAEIQAQGIVGRDLYERAVKATDKFSTMCDVMDAAQSQTIRSN